MKYQIKIESDLKNVSVIRNIISTIVLSYNPTISFINELKTIISEAVTNSIIHGYMEGPGIIELEIETNEEMIILKIKDYGVGIPNIKEALEPMFTTKKESERSGLGFTIMEVFSNKMEVISSKEYTEVTIQKKWKNE